MEQREKVIVILGPTAVGKTKLSIDVAKAYNGEIINGDSTQVYKSLDIGTAKITKEEMEGIPHHLIDIKECGESFSVAEFQQQVRGLITDINGRGKTPIIAGGTGLYIQAVLYDYAFSDVVASDEPFRQSLEEIAAKEGNEYVHAKLQAVDPKSAEAIHPNNVRRVIRALEVHHVTGTPFSEQLAQQENKLMYDVAVVGLDMEREKLYSRINERVHVMMEQGLLDEVKQLREKGIEMGLIQAIGYKELDSYLSGRVSLAEAIQSIQQNSRRYAKRQLTWFRNKMDVEWFDMTDLDYDGKLTLILQYIEGKLGIKENTY